MEKKIFEIDGKEYELDLKQAQALGILTPKKELPMSYEEFIKQNHGQTYAFDNFETTKKLNACIALAKLTQLRDVWREGSEDNSFFIAVIDGRLQIVYDTAETRLLSFPTDDKAKKFYDTFLDLILTAKELL